MTKNLEQSIENFISDLKKAYPKIIFAKKFDNIDDYYTIYHNHKEFSEDTKFCEKVCVLFEQYFYSDGFYNVGFSYDFKLENYSCVSSSKVSITTKYEASDIYTYANQIIVKTGSTITTNTQNIVMDFQKNYADGLPAGTHSFHKSSVNYQYQSSQLLSEVA